MLFERQIFDDVAGIRVQNEFERRRKLAVDALKISTVTEVVVGNRWVFGNARVLVGRSRSS